MPSGEPVRRTDTDTGTTFLRDGVTLAFFLPMPFGEVASAVLGALDATLSRFPAGALRWAAVGAYADAWKPLTPAALERCRSQLTGGGPSKRELTAFQLGDGDQGGDAPGYGVLVQGNKPDQDLPEELNLFQCHFPVEAVGSPRSGDAFVEWAIQLAGTLPYVTGYASPALTWAESMSGPALTAAWGLARRHPGYDVENNQVTRSELGVRVRGARWLTFLGPELIDKLGGSEAVGAGLPAGIDTRPAGHGLVVRAGVIPEIGDTNRRQETPLLRAVAARLEPVTVFDEPGLLRCEFGADRPDEFAAWERRFLD